MNSLLLSKTNTIIIDKRADQETINNLKKLNLNIIFTIKCEEVQEPISCHPDIQLHPINNELIIVAPNVFEHYNKIFKKTNIKLIKGETTLGYNYPMDIPYNIGRIGNFAIHNSKYTDELTKYYLKKEGIELIDVKQGYSKCSLGIIGKNSAITSDQTIYEKLKNKNIDILLVKKGYINLDGYNYGFIGGSMGNIDNENILITGELKTHIDGDKINKFIKNKNKKIIELKKDKIEDLGSLIPLFLKK